MRGRAATLAALAVATQVLLPAPARAADKAPPPVPSSYDLRRVETILRAKAEREALAAKRKSRQVEYTGAGDAAGSGDTSPFDIDIDITDRQLGALVVTGVIGAAALRALNTGTAPDLGVFDDPGSSGGAAAASAAATATTTGTQ